MWIFFNIDICKHSSLVWAHNSTEHIGPVQSRHYYHVMTYFKSCLAETLPTLHHITIAYSCLQINNFILGRLQCTYSDDGVSNRKPVTVSRC